MTHTPPSMVNRIYSRGKAADARQPEERNRQACADLWHHYGIAALCPAELTDDWLRQGIINEANRQYGERGNG